MKLSSPLELLLIRRLVGLCLAGVFDKAKAILVGNSPVTGFEDPVEATKDLIKNFVVTSLLPRKIDIPVVYSSRFGHGAFNDIMPFGTKTSLVVYEKMATLKVSVNESIYTK